MQHIRNSYLLFTAILFAPSFAFAKDCSDAKDSVSVAECHVARYAAADKKPNQVYRAAINSLSDTEDAKPKQAQQAWLKYRDASFAFVIEINKDSRSYGSIFVADYKATFVEKRVLEIQYLLSSPEATKNKGLSIFRR